MGNTFTVDVSFDAAWLEAALESRRAGKLVRVAVVIRNAGPGVTYAAGAIGGGENEYLVASVAGDFTKEPAWRGE